MRIGIIGTRGIPNHYGGYEQFVEFAAPELVRRGHELYVYNSSSHPYGEKMWKGVHIISKYDPENRIGTAGQFIYDLNCILDARKRSFDVILQLGYTSSSVWSFLFPKNAFLITNMDGLEWKRSKYSKTVQNFLKHAERWAAIHSDFLIADSTAIQKYLREKYNKESIYIAYGAEDVCNPNLNVVHARGLKEKSYNILVARMEPENNVEMIIKGHLQSGTINPLIIVGNYHNHYGRMLHKQYASDRVRFLDAVYDIRILNSLRYFARFYFHGHSVGGTNPSLLEAMASHSLIAAHDNPFNRGVLGNDAFYFHNAEELARIINSDFSEESYEWMIRENLEKIRNDYSWDYIIQKLERFLLDVTRR